MKLHQKPLTRGGTVALFLACLSTGFSSLANAAVCDVDTDGDVDRRDLRLIVGARNKPASGPDDPRDADADGTITVPDARICVRQCNLPGCKIIDPAPPEPGEDARQADVTPAQKAATDISKPGRSTSDQAGTVIQGKTKLSGTDWKVKRGDTLYAIARAVFPGDANKQARLRQDIIELNPSVFANGANNMAVGVVLKLPDYVAPKAAPPKVVVKPEPEPEPPSEVVPAPKEEQEEEMQVKKQPFAISLFGAERNIVLSLGYSFGGDKLEYEDGSYDPAGASGHLRLGYEPIYPHAGGYRAAFGLQYGRTSDGVTLRDTYLQLAYQYRAHPFLYGIGVVLHQGAEVSDDSTIEYDAANGLVVYLENIGDGELADWGLSYTSLDIEDKDSGESFDASRVELYYGWKF